MRQIFILFTHPIFLIFFSNGLIEKALKEIDNDPSIEDINSHNKSALLLIPDMGLPTFLNTSIHSMKQKYNSIDNLIYLFTKVNA
jgi:hypothetical protein